MDDLHQVREADQRQVLFSRVRVATTPWQRTVGLLGRPRLAPLDGLWLEPGRSIHTFVMRFAIDCVFLDREGTIVRVSTCIPPYRVRFGPRCTRHVLELAAGAGSRLAVGQRLILEPRSSGRSCLAAD